jgi:hypothetical protein
MEINSGIIGTVNSICDRWPNIKKIYYDKIKNFSIKAKRKVESQ